MKKESSHTGELQMFQAEAPWTFIMIPKSKVPGVPTRGWGSIPLIVTVGNTAWRTSMFPFPKRNEYFIPIKKSVRDKESVGPGDTVTAKWKVAE